MTAGVVDPADRRKIRRDSFAVAMTVAPYGFSFGALASATGFSLAQVAVLSAIGFTGASQFAFVSVLGSGGTPAGAISTALLLGARNTLYAVRMTALMDWRGTRRLLGGHFTIDETVAMATARDDPAQSREAFWATATMLWVTWNLSSLIGAWVGGSIADPKDWGLDAVFPAAFLALLVPQLRSRTKIAAAIAGAVVTLVLAPFVPAGVPLLAAAVAVVPLALRSRR